MTVEERFWGRVERRTDEECWPWLGNTAAGGYGTINVGGRNVRAHRYAYELLVGQVPDGLQLDHTCHNADPDCAGGKSCAHRACVNPAHLEPVTRAENILRGKGVAAIQARKTHCDHGHEFTPENSIPMFKNGKPAGKRCRTCQRELEARRYAGPRCNHPGCWRKGRRVVNGVRVCGLHKNSAVTREVAA